MRCGAICNQLTRFDFENNYNIVDFAVTDQELISLISRLNIIITKCKEVSKIDIPKI